MEHLPAKLSVAEFVDVTNQILDTAYPVVEVEGEVASFKINQSKFVFFDLKDAAASVGCFMMAFQLRVPLVDGMKVIVTAQPKLTTWGKFSLTVRAVRPSGEGSIKKSFELLKKKLDSEGLFAPERKRPLPVSPRRIAVISSTQAAGYADFLAVLDERWGGLDVEVAHVQVQGESAPDQMIRALNYFNTQSELADVLVMIRGGGSADDLAAYNDELLVRAVAASRVPVLTGIGHETDTSLVDLAADRSAVTPTAAAQIVVPDKRVLLAESRQQLRTAGRQAHDALERLSAESRHLLLTMASRAVSRLDDIRQQVRHQQALLTAYNPDDVLARGYAMLRGDRQVGAMLEIRTKDQDITAEVTHVKNR